MPASLRLKPPRDGKKIGLKKGVLQVNYETGHAIFEATHGTAPKYAGLDEVNPGSVILSGAMMFEHLGWVEAAGKIHDAMAATIRQKRVTYDFARLLEGATAPRSPRC